MYPGPVPGLSIEPAVLARLSVADLVVANLECPVTAVDQPAVEKGVHLRSSPVAAGMLDDVGVRVASLANNHMFDFGDDGFRDTVAYLEANEIAWVGAGRNLLTARQALVTSADGLSVGFLAYSAPEIETACATVQSPGCAPLDPGMIEMDVSKLAGDVDVTIVLLHWGLIGYELPKPEHLRLGRSFVDAGATLVVGSHPHVLQGIAEHGSGLMAFSLGDFAFYPATASGRAVNQYRARQTGMILTVEVEPGRVVSHEVFLTRQQGTHVGVEESRRRHAAVTRASARLTGPVADYQRRWKRHVVRRTLSRTVKRLAPWKWKTIRRGTVRGFGVALREIFKR
jgi:poly-gamma-glutamate synthesis protein (capsule biosynthesis protein)